MNHMSGIWLVSYFVLWLVVLLLILTVFSLARQIGLLHRRLGIPRARMENAGPRIGDTVPELMATDIHGRESTLGSERNRKTLLAFVSAGCSSCEKLASSLRSVWKSERHHLEVILVSMGGDEKRNRDFVSRHQLDEIPYILDPEIATQYSIQSPPYCLIIDEHRVLRAKGRTNHMEHLESLFNAVELGHPTLESFR